MSIDTTGAAFVSPDIGSGSGIGVPIGAKSVIRGPAFALRGDGEMALFAATKHDKITFSEDLRIYGLSGAQVGPGSKIKVIAGG